MDLNNNQFSDIPALGDVEGLENYMNTESLKSLGIPNNTPNDTQPIVQTNDDTNAQNDVAPTNVPAQPTQGTTGVSREEFDNLVKSISDIRESLQQRTVQAPQPQPTTGPVYTAQQMQFINTALQRGYSMEQILATLQKNAGQDANSQKITAIENYLKQQQVQRLENEFIEKMTAFGNKWGLSEQDLVTFGQKALSLGINVATVTDLDTVFRAVYPEQYAIRSKRMQNTPSSQIYGGTSIPESTRAMASRAEDAYVENFLAHTMPNMYNTSKK